MSIKSTLNSKMHLLKEVYAFGFLELVAYYHKYNPQFKDMDKESLVDFTILEEFGWAQEELNGLIGQIEHVGLIRLENWELKFNLERHEWDELSEHWCFYCGAYAHRINYSERFYIPRLNGADDWLKLNPPEGDITMYAESRRIVLYQGDDCFMEFHFYNNLEGLGLGCITFGVCKLNMFAADPYISFDGIFIPINTHTVSHVIGIKNRPMYQALESA